MKADPESHVDKTRRLRTKTVGTKERSLLSQLLGDHGIPGVIAIGVIGTICFIAIQQTVLRQPIEIPKYFTEISSLIIGYYFGTHTRKKAKKPDDG